MISTSRCVSAGVEDCRVKLQKSESNKKSLKRIIKSMEIDRKKGII